MTKSKMDVLKGTKPGRFLVVKFGSLGDIVHCLPSVAQLRNAFPDAEIDWLIERKNKIVVELSRLDVQLIPIDTYQWRNSPGIGSAKEIAEELGLQPKTVSNHLTALRAQGRAKPLGNGRWSVLPDPFFKGTGNGKGPTESEHEDRQDDARERFRV